MRFSSWRKLPKLRDDIVGLLQETEHVLLLTKRLEVSRDELSNVETAVLTLLERQRNASVRSYRDMDAVERRWLSPLANSSLALSKLLGRGIDMPASTALTERANVHTAIESASNRSLEQAQAAWIDWLAQVRLSKLVEALARQDLRLEDALEQLDICRERIVSEVIERGAGRGGPRGAKGFIAERLDVYIENARSAIRGAEKAYKLMDDNGAMDYARLVNNVLTGIQQKFDMRRFGVEAIKRHHETYPDFVRQGGIYRIPADFYAELKRLSSVPVEEAQSLRLAQRNIIEELRKLEAEGIKLGSTIEPTSFDHMDAYQENYAKTLAREQEGILEEDRAARDKAGKSARPAAKEAAAAVAVGAIVEGGSAFALKVYEKLRSGKRLAEFSAEDWRESGLDALAGSTKGAVRGGAVYLAVNYTPVPWAAATAMVTATFGIVSQARAWSKGEVTEEEFVAGSQALCIETAVSAVFATIGQNVIPIPVFGALVGSAVGSLMYDIARESLPPDRVERFRCFQKEIVLAEERLGGELCEEVESYELELAKYCALVDLAIGTDALWSLRASVELAELAGVPEHDIQHGVVERNAAFLD